VVTLCRASLIAEHTDGIAANAAPTSNWSGRRFVGAFA